MLSFMSNLQAAPAFTSILSTPQTILAVVGAENASILLTGVLLSLVIIYLASKIGAEISLALKLPPVLGELVGGIVIGVSALHAIVFADSGLPATDAGVMVVLQWIYQLSPTVATTVFESQSEVISVLAELGVIILLFEIGLESDLRQFRQVGAQAIVVACVGVVAPFAAGTVGLMAIFHVAAIPAIFAGGSIDSY